MRTIFTNAQDAFEYMYDYILTYGTNKSGTKFINNVNICLINPTQNVIETPWRKWSHDYALFEYQWYLSGNPSVKEIGKRAKIWNDIADENGNVNSNYGYQWQRNDQLSYVIKELMKDPNSRRACLTIYDAKESAIFKNDTPCTLNICFNIVDDKLNMTVMMRSNDLVYGFCNDQFCFSMLQNYIAEYLNIPVGNYYHSVIDMHIYERHYDIKK